MAEYSIDEDEWYPVYSIETDGKGKPKNDLKYWGLETTKISRRWRRR
jgi:hypothetical protein